MRCQCRAEAEQLWILFCVGAGGDGEPAESAGGRRDEGAPGAVSTGRAGDVIGWKSVVESRPRRWTHPVAMPVSTLPLHCFLSTRPEHATIREGRDTDCSSSSFLALRIRREQQASGSITNRAPIHHLLLARTGEE